MSLGYQRLLGLLAGSASAYITGVVGGTNVLTANLAPSAGTASSWQWQRNAVNIAGQTAQTYTQVPASDSGTTLSVQINAGAFSASVTIPAIPPVFSAAPIITAASTTAVTYTAATLSNAGAPVATLAHDLYAASVPLMVNYTSGAVYSTQAAGVLMTLIPRAVQGGNTVVGPTSNALAVTSGPVLPQLANLRAQWSADSITAQTDNTDITATWIDSIGSVALTPSTTKPKYRTSALGGKPGVQFLGTGWFSGLAPTLKTQVDTRIHSVFIFASNIQARSNACMFGNGAGGNSFAFFGNGTVVGRGIASVELRGPYTDTVTPISCGYTSTTAKAYPAASSAALERQYLNGMCVAANLAACPVTSSASGAFAIGATSDLGTFPYQGYIHEVLVWDKTLTPAEMVQVEAWCRSKYSLPLPWASSPYLFHFDGDSHTVGVGGTVNMNNSYPYLNAQSLGLPYGTWSNNGIGGMTLYGMYGGDGGAKFSDMAAMVTATGKPGRFVCSEYYNQVAAGRVSQSFADFQAYIGLLKSTFPTSKVGWWEPFSYGTDAATYATNRGPFITSVRAGYAAAGVDYLALVGNDTNLGTSDAFTNFGATLWSGDTVHILNTTRVTNLSPYTLAACNAINS